MKKVVIVGAGFAGCTMAHMLKEKGFEVTLIEATDGLGGNCRTFIYHGHPYTFGPHHLLVNIDETYIWDYFSRFLELRELKHYNMTYVNQDDRFYTYPIHVDEIEEMPDGDKIHDELQNRGDVAKSKDYEEYWVNSVGKTLYDKFINSYTKKMWQVSDNREIDEFKFSPKGVALKTGSKECFEDSKKIGYPLRLDGYNSYFDECARGCRTILGKKAEKFDIDCKKVYVNGEWIEGDLIVSTISVDTLLDYRYGNLRYLGRELLKVILPIEHLTPDPYVFLYYAGDEPYTRIVEYKLLTGYKAPDTLIGIEFPSDKNKLYPYPIKSEIARAQKYFDDLPDGVFSIGRLGGYHYTEMTEIVKICMELVKNI